MIKVICKKTTTQGSRAGDCIWYLEGNVYNAQFGSFQYGDKIELGFYLYTEDPFSDNFFSLEPNSSKWFMKFKDYFYTEKEYRKLKINKLNEINM